MKKHWNYLKYVIQHKYFVYVAGRKIGLSLWLSIFHDWSKFRFSEWFPYVEFFYGGNHLAWSAFSAGEKYLAMNAWNYSQEGVQHHFDMAWLAHQHRNKHHWQHWIIREDDGGTKPMPMPWRYIAEMVADWAGAGRAITGEWELKKWWDYNKHKIVLEKHTLITVEQLIDELTNGANSLDTEE